MPLNLFEDNGSEVARLEGRGVWRGYPSSPVRIQMLSGMRGGGNDNENEREVSKDEKRGKK